MQSHLLKYTSEKLAGLDREPELWRSIFTREECETVHFNTRYSVTATLMKRMYHSVTATLMMRMYQECIGSSRTSPSASHCAVDKNQTSELCGFYIGPFFLPTSVASHIG